MCLFLVLCAGCGLLLSFKESERSCRRVDTEKKPHGRIPVSTNPAARIPRVVDYVVVLFVLPLKF